MKRTNLYLDEEQTELLDRLASDTGVSRAELVRRLLDRALQTRGDDLDAALAAIDDSFGVLSDLEHVPRGTGEREEHLVRVWRTAA